MHKKEFMWELIFNFYSDWFTKKIGIIPKMLFFDVIQIDYYRM
jgi:hypothetical protein